LSRCILLHCAAGVSTRNRRTYTGHAVGMMKRLSSMQQRLCRRAPGIQDKSIMINTCAYPLTKTLEAICICSHNWCRKKPNCACSDAFQCRLASAGQASSDVPRPLQREYVINMLLILFRVGRCCCRSLRRRCHNCSLRHSHRLSNMPRQPQVQFANRLCSG